MKNARRAAGLKTTQRRRRPPARRRTALAQRRLNVAPRSTMYTVVVISMDVMHTIFLFGLIFHRAVCAIKRFLEQSDNEQ